MRANPVRQIERLVVVTPVASQRIVEQIRHDPICEDVIHAKRVALGFERLLHRGQPVIVIGRHRADEIEAEALVQIDHEQVRRAVVAPDIEIERPPIQAMIGRAEELHQVARADVTRVKAVEVLS